MSIIMFAGTGRTGKTVVVNELIKKAQENNKVAIAIPSVVRGYMQSQGLDSEKAFYDLSQADRTRVQKGLIEEYFLNLDRVIENQIPDEMYIFDRSPFDHFGYAAYNNLSLEDRAHFRQKCHNYLIHHCKRLIHFPWPCPWTNNKDSDAFRHYDEDKERFVSTFISQEINFLVETTGNIKWRTDSSNTLSPKVRADIIYGLITR